MSLRILLIISLLITLPLNAREFYFCSIKVDNPFPLERGFITSYLTSAVERILLETGWVQNCKKGPTVRIKVENLSFKGSSISGNRFSGYTLKMDINIKIGEFNKNYHFSKYIALPDPSLGTLRVRSTLADIFETSSIRIKFDLLNFLRKKNHPFQYPNK